VHLIDISPTALELSERTLNRFEHVSVVGHRATYEEGLRRAAAERNGRGTMFVLFLGSNIGNFDPPAAHDFLLEIRRALRPGDALLLGADLVKPERELQLAYDDPLGVTAAFNRNLLARMNTELLADFDLSAFDHRAVWSPGDRRVEMRLVSAARRRSRSPRTRPCASPGSSSGRRAPTVLPEQVTAMGAAARFGRSSNGSNPRPGSP
jgi:uncharacterized SAM-dependent methyltransferase